MASVFVQVLRGRDLAKVQVIGIQDPYVIVKYGDVERQTRTCNDGGEDPVFNETFSLPLVPGNSVMHVKVLNERGRNHGVIGQAKVDFAAALEKGSLDAKVPIITQSGSPKGYLELCIKVPQRLAAAAGLSGAAKAPAATVAAATEGIKDMRVDTSATETYNHALSEARAKYYADVETAMVPHKAVCTGLASNFVESVKEVKEETEQEMGKIFEAAQKKLTELAEESVTEWGKLGMEFRDEIGSTIVKHDPGAKEKFAKNLEALSSEMYENGGKAKQLFEQAMKDLAEGMVTLETTYKASMSEAIEKYESGFYKCLSRYKHSVEDVLKGEAEAKAREAAGPPPPAPPPAPVQAAPHPPPPAAAPYPPPHAYDPPPPVHRAPPPQYYAPPPVQAAPPPPVAYYPYTPAPGAGVAAGAAVGAAAASSSSEAEQARRAAEEAKQQAYYSQQAAMRAQMEAEQQRQQAQQAQALMTAEIMANRRRRAVRRGVVGGMLLAKIID